MEKNQVGYRGKHFTVPQIATEGFEIIGLAKDNLIHVPTKEESPIIADLNSIWDLKKFLNPRIPLSLGKLSLEEQMLFSQAGMPRTLDMPIKFPGSNFRIPKTFEQFIPVIQRVANYEAAINPDCFDEYYCYMTIDQGTVKPETLQREAPCHVDGFQGARWKPKVRINHTYVVGDKLPTSYYIQPFDFAHLDEAKHNFFWEMNKIVAETNSKYVWTPEENEINLIDAYTVHRGTEATVETFRTWMRLSFEVRKFDRLGNAHNPLFQYDWDMVPRDIEGLHLIAFDESIDPSLRVFPWQDINGEAHQDPKKRTKPRLVKSEK